MSIQYLSELRLVSFGVIPKGWAQANGQSLPINQNNALFALLGTTYGGNGQTNFNLPNLLGRAPIHAGNGYTLGQNGGEASHTLTVPETPLHLHTLQGINGAFTVNAGPANNLLSNTTGNLGIYGPPNNLEYMFPADIGIAGGSQPHPNQSPFLVMTWLIALTGIFPSQN
jgi:microcystin-dependent protein